MRKLSTLATLALVVAGAGPAWGDGLPVRYSHRPLTLPRGELSIDVTYTFARITVPWGIDTRTDSAMYLDVGGAYGITNDLQLDATVLPFRLDPDFAYENPSIGALYRLVEGNFELGVGLHFILPIEEGSDFTMPLSLPMLFRLGRTGRIDMGVQFAFIFAGEATYDVSLPFALLFQPANAIYLGPVTGLYWNEFDVGKTVYSPLGMLAGFTIASDAGHALLDILVRFDFPYLLTWGSFYPDAADTDLWTVSLGFALHLDVAGH